MKWQPIETAPKDGSQILTWRANWPGLMAAKDKCWFQISFWSDQHWGFVCWPKNTQPTHWMQLPEPPKEGE